MFYVEVLWLCVLCSVCAALRLFYEVFYADDVFSASFASTFSSKHTGEQVIQVGNSTQSLQHNLPARIKIVKIVKIGDVMGAMRVLSTGGSRPPGQ